MGICYVLYTDFSFYLVNQFDWPKYFLDRTHTKCLSNKIREILVYLFVEKAAVLDYIKDKVAKRTEEIIFHAECEKNVQIA